MKEVTQAFHAGAEARRVGTRLMDNPHHWPDPKYLEQEWLDWKDGWLTQHLLEGKPPCK